MNEKVTTVFSYGEQVEHTRMSYREVSVNCNGKDIETTNLMIDDVLHSPFYALASYKDQLGRLEVEGDVNADTYVVLDALLSHANNKMEKIVDTLERHLGGRIYFLKTLPGQLTIHDMKKIGDYAGIMVKNLDEKADNGVELEQEVTT